MLKTPYGETMAGDNNSSVVVQNQVFESESIEQNSLGIIIQSNQLESSSDSDNNTDQTTHSDSNGIAHSNVSSVENDTALHKDSNKTPARLTVEKVPGKRRGSEVYYVVQESQF